MNSSKISVLFVEDDCDLGNVLTLYLQMNGFEVSYFENGRDAIDALSSINPDICLLDVNIPEIDGFELAQLIKGKCTIPFIFLTARKQKEDRLKGLQLGADDYITKPFEADELVLRIKNILSRTKRVDDAELWIGSYKLSPENMTLTRNEHIHSLTERETEFLAYLAKRKNELIKKQELLEELWGENDYFLGRSMDVFLTRIRKYLKDDPSIKFENVRGVGFRFFVD